MKNIQILLTIEGGVPIDQILAALDQPWVKSFAFKTEDRLDGRAPRGAKRAAVVAALPGTKEELIKKTGLPAQTVASALQALRAAGSVSNTKGIWRTTK